MITICGKFSIGGACWFRVISASSLLAGVAQSKSGSDEMKGLGLWNTGHYRLLL